MEVEYVEVDGEDDLTLDNDTSLDVSREDVRDNPLIYERCYFLT